ncbi:DNA-processing protein DprA [Leucobacter viscericola]|nr:DNA-processing protein DprA [Leucobacter viscericola]
MKRWLPRLDRVAVLADISLAAAAKAHAVLPESAAWPMRLNDLGPHAPVMLWARGEPSLLSQASLAVVGARACTSYGTYVTADLVSSACAAGITITSGAAYGIDAVAHRAALAAEAPTIAVLAGGVDRPYPSAHGALLEKIASTGVVCSEVVPGTAPTRWRFLQRNRIIAALSQATLITEAGLRSGSLNTAGHSAEIGRPLGVVPGPVTSPASLGCHRLIREYGATLISNGADLRELLGLSDLEVLNASEAGGLSANGVDQPRESAMHRRVIDALPLRGWQTVAVTARTAGADVEEVSAALAELELLGCVVRRETPNGGDVQWSQKRGE